MRPWLLRLRWWTLRALRLVLLFYVLVVALLMLFEEKLIYFPAGYDAAAYDARSSAPREDVFATASDGVRIHSWFSLADAKAPTLLWFHGNAGNIADRLDQLERLHAAGFNVMAVDLRGYGRSEGKPSEQGTYRDAEAAWDALVARADIDRARIVIYGQSLGCAVALDLALRRPCERVILEAPFASIPAMAKVAYPIPGLSLLARTRYDNLGKAAHLALPLLVIQGTRDEVIPTWMGKAVFDAAPGPKEFWAVAGAHHDDCYLVAGREYFDRLRRFCGSP